MIIKWFLWDNFITGAECTDVNEIDTVPACLELRFSRRGKINKHIWLQMIMWGKITVNMAWGGRKEQEYNSGQKVESFNVFEFKIYLTGSLTC